MLTSTYICSAIYIYFKRVSRYPRHYKDSLLLLLQSRINNQMSQRKDKIWKVNLVILMKLRMPPQASHDGWCCGSLSTEPSTLLYLKNDHLRATSYQQRSPWKHVWKRNNHTQAVHVLEVRKETNVSSSLWRVKKTPCSLFPLSFSFSFYSHTFPPHSLPPSRQTDKDKCHSRLSLLRRGPKGCRIIFFFFSCLMMWFCFLQK